MKKLLAFTLAFTILNAALPLLGDVLPAAITLAHCVQAPGPVIVDDPTSSAVTDAFGSLTVSPFVSANAQAAFPGLVGGGSASISIQYFFQVVGGNPGDTVPILIATNLNVASTSSGGGSFGFAETAVHTSRSGDTFATVCTDGTCGTSATQFSGTISWLASSGAIGDYISVQAVAAVGDSLTAQSSTAFADPFLFIDPAFANAAQYSIVLSPGVGNGLPATVPEPATLGLTSLASVLLILKRWRRRC
jgi:hypothetical protein